MSDAPTVFVVDDDHAVLASVTRLLKREGILARPFRTPEAFLVAHEPALPGCVVLEPALVAQNGLALQEMLVEAGCERFLIFIAGQGDIASGVRAMKAGAVDFLQKPFRDEDLLAAVHDALARDQATRSRNALHELIHQRITSLTPREREVLEQVIAGRLNKQIAADLGTVEKTIKVHRARVMDKLGAGSVAELVRLCLQVGLGNAPPTLRRQSAHARGSAVLDQGPIAASGRAL